MFIDTHCHLDDEKFSDIAFVVKESEKNGVKIMISMGTNAASSRENLNISKEFSSVFFASGLHPSDAYENYEKELKEIEKLLSDKKCVAVGEIGLDYHWTIENKEFQKKAFAEQISLADAYKLPFSVHSRDATADTVEIIKENARHINCGAVMHCFSGSYETAKILIDLGFYIGFGGTLTFKNSVKLKEVCEKIPLEFILTETDSPYLAPEPLRGTLNAPYNIPYVVKEIAKIKNLRECDVEKAIEQNARKLFAKLK